MNYRNISTGFWSDPKVEDDFTPEDKYFYLYLLTNEHTNLCGCYEISIKAMTEDTGYNKDTISKLLERFEKIHNVIRYSPVTKEVLLLNWRKYNWSKSEKVAVAVKKVAKHIKCDEFRNYVIWAIDTRMNSTQETDNSITVRSTQETDNSTQYTDTISDTEVSIGYGYGIDTIKVDYQRIVDMYNDTCVSFPRLKSLSESRKKAIRARLKTYSYEDFQLMFTKAEDSDFLKGSNNRDWSATFDWLIKDSNMAKVLEGNYDNKSPGQQARKGSKEVDVVSEWLNA